MLPKYTHEEAAQESLYDQMALEYDRKTNDLTSQEYRRRFINEPLMGNVDLSGKEVLDGMCGTGQTTGYLLGRKASVTAIDISSQQTDLLREKYPSCTVMAGSILNTGLDSESFDCVVVVGGLHHLHPSVNNGVNEIHRILKPGGYFVFAECHSGTVPNCFRRWWYKWDSLFLENEAAIDCEQLERDFASRFCFLKKEYRGSIAYLLVGAAPMLRIPTKVKLLYARSVMAIESAIEPFLGARLSCMVLCQWAKK